MKTNIINKSVVNGFSANLDIFILQADGVIAASGINALKKLNKKIKIYEPELEFYVSKAIACLQKRHSNKPFFSFGVFSKTITCILAHAKNEIIRQEAIKYNKRVLKTFNTIETVLKGLQEHCEKALAQLRASRENCR
jgi:hypothetical protein